MGISHLSLDFRPGHKRRYRVYDDKVQGPASYKHVRYLQGLFTRVGLAQQEVVRVYAELFCIFEVEGVFSIDEGDGAAAFLRLRGYVQREGCLDGRDVRRQAPFAEFHYGAFTELLFYLAYRKVYGLVFVRR
jgi:hypothetical protein